MTLNTTLQEHVRDQVDRRFDDTVAFLQTLVRQPSTLGNERGVQNEVYARLSQLELSPEMWDLNLDVLRASPNYGPLDLSYSDRPNVTAIWRAAGEGGHSLALNGHVDVVSPEPLANWTHDPWGAQIDGEWMYGRGAADMKGGVAAMILAVEAVRAAGVGLRGNVIIESVIEEECTGNGALACALRGYKGDAAIIPESHGLSASLATVGVIWFRVRTRGQASHVLAADSAVNAIEKMYPIITALRGLETDLNARERPAFYRDLAHPVNLNVGVIRSGDWPSTVPSECTLECRLSCLPGMSVNQLQQLVRAAVTGACENDSWLREYPATLEFFGFRAEPSVVNPKGPGMQMLAECHTAVVGTPVVFKPLTATTDERFFINNLQMEATSYGPTGERIHAGEERVYLPSIKQVAQVLALYMLRWCGVVD